MIPDRAKSGQTKDDISELAEMDDEDISKIRKFVSQANILQHSYVRASHLHRSIDAHNTQKGRSDVFERFAAKQAGARRHVVNVMKRHVGLRSYAN